MPIGDPHDLDHLLSGARRDGCRGDLLLPFAPIDRVRVAVQRDVLLAAENPLFAHDLGKTAERLVELATTHTAREMRPGRVRSARQARRGTDAAAQHGRGTAQRQTERQHRRGGHTGGIPARDHRCHEVAVPVLFPVRPGADGAAAGVRPVPRNSGQRLQSEHGTVPMLIALAP